MRIFGEVQRCSRLEQLSDEQEKLKTELVQIQSMLLSIEQLIAEEILNQAAHSSPSTISALDGKEKRGQ
jgi:cell shape-determining protein MreC